MHLYFVSHTDFSSRKQLVMWTQKPILVSDVQEGTVWLTLLFSLLIWIHTGSLWLHIYNSVYFMQCISKPNNIETTIFLKFRQIMTQNGLSSWRQHCRNSSKLTGYPGGFCQWLLWADPTLCLRNRTSPWFFSSFSGLHTGKWFCNTK